MNKAKYPLIYEINTWVWLNELAEKHRRPIDLGTVPTVEWDALGALGVDAVWFMGVWERSPAGIAIAVKNQGLQEDFRRALPDLEPEDIVGSPYCIRRYIVDEQLGGREGLAKARQNLAKRNIQLVLDFVPNHVAPDHPWVDAHPEYFVPGESGDLQRDPDSFFETGGRIYARGRDPYFPAWPDVLQLNAFNNGLRKAAIETLTDIAQQSDGVRCDMAMLLLNEVFARTWGNRAGARPSEEYWGTVIPAVKQQFPEFTFIAEAYWDLEWQLQQQGFDFCYDKRLYDRLCHDNAESVVLHLCADMPYQERLVRFVENHDEPRAAGTFPPGKHEAATIITMTLPGAKLLHEGQLDGRKVRLPVFLSRRPDEPDQPSLREFYAALLKMIGRDVFRNGQWSLCHRSGWPDNTSFHKLVASCWDGTDERFLIIVNYSNSSSQGNIRVPWKDMKDHTWQLTDMFSNAAYERTGNDLVMNGLYVDLNPWAAHCFRIGVPQVETTRAPKPSSQGNGESAIMRRHTKKTREVAVSH